jgi:translation initiation factor 4E
MAAAVAEIPTTGEAVDLSTIPISPEGGNKVDGGKATPADAEQITVFHDPDNFNVKHPLTHKWTLWFTKPPSGKVSNVQYGYNQSNLANMLCRVITGMICLRRSSLSTRLRNFGVSMYVKFSLSTTRHR